MAKYKYYISFDDESTYSEVFPSKVIDITGVWVPDTWIDRVDMSELYIGRLKNATVYDVLESWYDDPTKFAEDIYFKIEKASVLKWKFIFGIKWGKINEYKKTYTVNPETYDDYRIEVQPYLGQEIERLDFNQIAGASTLNSYDENDTDYKIEDTQQFTNTSPIFYFIETMIGRTDSSISVVSTFMNNDNDESGSPLLTVNGVRQDYVTGEEDLMSEAVFVFNNTDDMSMTVGDYIEKLKLFQVNMCIDENDDLRLEHEKYHIDYLEDNAVVVSIDKNYDEFEYSRPELIFRETLEMSEDDDKDEDYIKTNILYDTSQNDINTQQSDHSYKDIYSNFPYYFDNQADYDGDLIFVPCVLEEIRKLTATGTTLFTTDFNTFDASGTSAFEIISNNINLPVVPTINVFVYIDITAGSFSTLKCGFYDRSTGAQVSTSEVNLSAGNNSPVLDITVATTDCVFKIKATPGPGTVEGYINVSRTYQPRRVAWDTGIYSGTGKNGVAFSPANIIDKWWRVYRPSNHGKMNSTSSYSTFTDSQYNLQRISFRKYYASDINMRYGINDSTRIGKIESYIRNLNTDFVEFSITYPEDE